MKKKFKKKLWTYKDSKLKISLNLKKKMHPPFYLLFKTVILD